MADLNPTPLTDPHFIKNQILSFACKLSAAASKQTPQIIHFQVLTPDSEACLFMYDGRIWCMYQEDFITGISQVRENLTEWLGKEKGFKLMLATRPYESLKDAPPVRTAEVYKLPSKDSEDFRLYADTNGYYFVFLAKMKSNDYFDFVD